MALFAGQILSTSRKRLIGSARRAGLAIGAPICQRSRLTDDFPRDMSMTFPGEQAQRSRAFARRGGGGPLWHFLRGFLKHPVMVGSVIP
ncbi:MAG: hypothetical protein ACJ8DZ_07005, partial [Allosphingosinicella sp.]